MTRIDTYLYPAFKHWYHGGNIYIYSDPHFDDEEQNAMIKNRPTSEEQVKSINSCLGKNDTIIILGDIGDPKYLKQIRGHKILLLGNHDSGRTVYEPYADEVYEGCVMINPKILLSHEPVDFRYAFNIHGHDHNSAEKNSKFHYNCCAERLKYKPVSLKNIMESGLLKNVPDVHRQAIDKATKRKKDKQIER